MDTQDELGVDFGTGIIDLHCLVDCRCLVEAGRQALCSHCRPGWNSLFPVDSIIVLE